MGDTIVHRGPDDHGEWADTSAGIALAHRRLSIIDLSPEGHQPMQSVSGRYMMVFNGEVYNFEELRKELPGVHWRGHSDTEVMLAAFERWGLEASVKRFVGMFVFALWDKHERTLHLVRDRLGVKPLYYARVGSTFLFGSELKTLRAHPDFGATIDRGSLALFIRHNYVPHPYSIYEGVKKLPPGTILSLRSPEEEAEPRAYWSAREIAEYGCNHQVPDDPQAATEELDALLREAVKMRMLSDVPLGAFLSGGIDSSVVVALMQSMSSRPVRTFSIGFSEREYNEAPHARAVAQHLGTDHTEMYVSPSEALAVVPELPHYYDEPFSDSSQIPTYLVSKLARSSVTVALSGDGGDELFAGYPRYALTQQMWTSFNRFPLGARRAAARAMRSLSAKNWNRLFRVAGPLLPRKIRVRRPGEQVQRLANMLQIDSQNLFYRSVVSHCNEPGRLVIGGQEHETVLTDAARQAQVADPVTQMMFADLVSYLPDDILTKVDRASMAVSLEARVPLIDHRVVEYAWRLPMSLRVREGKEKWLLRQVLYKYVPSKLIERPKMGFGVPIGEWLRGPLKEWAGHLLSPECIQSDGFFDSSLVERLWREHVEGQKNWQYLLWDIVMFQAWYEHVRTAPPTAARMAT